MSRYAYFSESEFPKCSPSCNIEDMDSDFLTLLDCARAEAGIPFVLNSAFRSSEYDKRRGRSGRGYHTLGRAVDISCYDGASRCRIVSACLNYGLSCGISHSFIHVDNRSNQVVFLY